MAPPVGDPSVASAPSGPSAPGQRRSRAGLWIGLAAGATALAVVGAVAGASLLTTTPTPTPTAPTVVNPQDPGAGFVPAPAELEGAVEGKSAEFTWTNPDPAEGDTYLWYPYTLEGEGQGGLVETETVTVPADPSGTTCIAVLIRREDGTTGSESRACTP
jgi:hypothetical protein